MGDRVAAAMDNVRYAMMTGGCLAWLARAGEMCCPRSVCEACEVRPHFESLVIPTIFEGGIVVQMYFQITLEQGSEQIERNLVAR